MFSIVRAQVRNFVRMPSLPGAKPVTSPPAALLSKAKPARLYKLFGKRCLDITLVLISAPVVLPVILFCALMVARDGAAPFYTQDRVGRNGRIYTMWKLRSMVPNAKAHLEAHLQANPDARREWDRKQKLAQDPRVTQVGHFLRKTSLDELPQLWNVLRGNMSLVGPRPMMPEQKPCYPGTDYYALLPGITGSWQVSARNETTFADRARFDSDYYRTLSLMNDIKLIAATLRVVLRGTGC